MTEAAPYSAQFPHHGEDPQVRPDWSFCRRQPVYALPDNAQRLATRRDHEWYSAMLRSTLTSLLNRPLELLAPCTPEHAA